MSGTPLANRYILPEAVIFIEDYSSIITDTTVDSTTGLGVIEGFEDVNGELIEYSAVTFTPNNRVRLASNEAWTLTLALEVDVTSNANALPQNFATIQFNPNTARATLIRP